MTSSHPRIITVTAVNHAVSVDAPWTLADAHAAGSYVVLTYAHGDLLLDVYINDIGREVMRIMRTAPAPPAAGFWKRIWNAIRGK